MQIQQVVSGVLSMRFQRISNREPFVYDTIWKYLYTRNEPLDGAFTRFGNDNNYRVGRVGLTTIWSVPIQLDITLFVVFNRRFVVHSVNVALGDIIRFDPFARPRA